MDGCVHSDGMLDVVNVRERARILRSRAPQSSEAPYENCRPHVAVDAGLPDIARKKYFICRNPQEMHDSSTAFPQAALTSVAHVLTLSGSPLRLKLHERSTRLAVPPALFCLLTTCWLAWPVPDAARDCRRCRARRRTAAPLFRVFLKDGTSLVSYGELARVEDRVVFSMPTSASPDNPQLHLVDIVGRARGLGADDQLRGIGAVGALPGDTGRERLRDADGRDRAGAQRRRTDDRPRRRLAIVERARKTLADWPARTLQLQASTTSGRCWHAGRGDRRAARRGRRAAVRSQPRRRVADATL